METCFTFAFVIFGAGIGATVGGAIGAVLVSRAAAARERSALPPEESPEEEVARLRAKMERIKDRIDDLEGDRPPTG